MSQLDAVLNRIDADLDPSLERLFALLRIQSVSTDPAYKDSCRAAAEYVAADLTSIGFAAEVRPTQGHPIVIGKSGNGKSRGQSESGKSASGIRPLNLDMNVIFHLLRIL